MQDRVLIVDDEPASRACIAYMASRMVGEIAVAPSGAEALEAIEQGHFDIVFLDHSMPGMDGLETARELKRRWPNTPIVVVSAGYDDAAHAGYQALGVTRFAPKPIRPEHIEAELKYARRAKTRAERDQSETTRPWQQQAVGEFSSLHSALASSDRPRLAHHAARLKSLVQDKPALDQLWAMAHTLERASSFGRRSEIQSALHDAERCWTEAIKAKRPTARVRHVSGWKIELQALGGASA